MDKDLTKPFVITYREGDRFIMETNLPNDTVGDMAFEYDFDGSERAKWEAHLKELEEKGIRGQLVHKIFSWQYDARFDEPDVKKSYPLESYNFQILNISKND